jgi:hypothetical protein
MRRMWLVLFWMLLMVSPLTAQDLEVRVFQLLNRPAEATVEPVRMVLSPAGTVMPDPRTQTLIVRDHSEALQRVGELLQRLDVPAPLIRLTIGFDSSAGRSGQGAGVAWDPARDRWTVGGGIRQTGVQTGGQQNLLVMSGEEARLIVARDLVEIRPFWTLAREQGLIPPGLVIRQVSTGFMVRPRAVGKQINVEVVPWFSYLGPDGPGDVRFTEAATTLRITEGQTVDLAGSSFQTEASRRAFGLVMGGGGDGSWESARLTLSARIQPDWSK